MKRYERRNMIIEACRQSPKTKEELIQMLKEKGCHRVTENSLSVTMTLIKQQMGLRFKRVKGTKAYVVVPVEVEQVQQESYTPVDHMVV